MSFLSTEIFGQMVEENFLRETRRKEFHEVTLFRALQKAIQSTSTYFPVEEFHGNRSQVTFPSHLPWTKPIARCELADLCIIWFRKGSRSSARITFFQAKCSHDTNLSTLSELGLLNELFLGDSTQWYLLHNRPSIVGSFHTFQPPSELLRGALLPSVASYGVFYKSMMGNPDFLYLSADVVSCDSCPKPGKTQLHASAPQKVEKIEGFAEQKFTFGIRYFAEALFSGRIGTPFGFDHSINSNWRFSTQKWLGSVFSGFVKNHEASPLLRSFTQSFEISLNQEPTDAPAKKLFLIQGDDNAEEFEDS